MTCVMGSVWIDLVKTGSSIIIVNIMHISQVIVAECLGAEAYELIITVWIYFMDSLCDGKSMKRFKQNWIFHIRIVWSIQ